MRHRRCPREGKNTQVNPVVVVVATATVAGLVFSGAYAAGRIATKPTDSPEYRALMSNLSNVKKRTAASKARAKELKRAETALTESQEDIDSRNTQLNETDDAIGKTGQEMKRYQDFAKEFGPSAGDANPQITVKAVGSVEPSYSCYGIPITVHNNTSTAITYYEIRCQLTDDAGNITYTGFANDSRGCVPDVDCAIMSHIRFNPTGMTLTSISWATGSGESSYGRSGTDVVTRKFWTGC